MKSPDSSLTSSPNSSRNEDRRQDDSFAISLSSNDETGKLFEACVKNDFPVCLDEALKVVFGTSREDAFKSIVDKARGRNTDKITSPEGIWRLYKRVIQEFQNELGQRKTKVIESTSLKKMSLMHCQKCPLYEFELSRLQETYK